ncbi:lasso peptide biosynthesis B2 protein [Isoptericola haloaureus]|uniref:Lasso peptide biosynthesis B2 protein n=1 Tax=Isoptericola haloaureus TaxID=1542902 RepID=A0ABU7Z4N3_9MICO
MNLRRTVSGIVLAARSAAVYVVAETGLRTLGLRRTCVVLGVRLSGPSSTAARTTLDTSRLTGRELRALRVARRVLRLRAVNGTCLRSALVLGRTLRARDPEIVLGVRRVGDRIAAHAWLRVDGADLDPEGLADRYLELGRPSGNAA